MKTEQRTAKRVAAQWILACSITAALSAPWSVLAQYEGSPKLPKIDPWCCDTPEAGFAKSGRVQPGDARQTPRHRAFTQSGVPLEYRGLENPFPASGGVIDAGAEVYAGHCVGCHGSDGWGDGSADRSLHPSPALLARMIEEPGTADAYLLWSISEGGEAFGSDMPAFKSVLTEDEIWEVVAYMRAGFSKVETSGTP